jgi:hypothetical protein
VDPGGWPVGRSRVIRVGFGTEGFRTDGASPRRERRGDSELGARALWSEPGGPLQGSKDPLGCTPPLPATRLPSWACPASRSIRIACLAALWFAAPSLPFLRLRGLRRAIPSGAMAPAAPSGLDVPAGYDPAAFIDAPVGRVDHLRVVPRPYSGHDLPEYASPGVSDLRHVPPSAFLTPSTVCSSNRLPALFRPVPLLGFSLQSLAPLRAAVRLSTPLLSCRS